MPVEAQLHGDLDTHGTFCITVPLNQILEMNSTLSRCNLEWEGRAKSNPNASRNLVVREAGGSLHGPKTHSSQITEAPFVVEKCVLLILRPDLFLPEGRPLLINNHRVLREPGGPPLSDSDAPSWTQYTPQSDSPYLVDASGQEFKEFDFVSERSQEGQRLSIFSLLVNANAKLQAAKRRKGYPPGIANYIVNIEAVVEQIFFVPRGIQDQALPLASGVPDGKETRGRDLSNISSKDGDLVDEERPDFNADPEYSDEYSGEDDEEGYEEYEEEYDEEDDEESDEPDTINGLTFPEMEIVIQRASDGTISAKERAEAAMLMLGMAGGERLLLSISSLLTPSTRP